MTYNSHFTAEVLSVHFWKIKKIFFFQFAGVPGWNNAKPGLNKQVRGLAWGCCGAVRSSDGVQLIKKFQAFWVHEWEELVVLWSRKWLNIHGRKQNAESRKRRGHDLKSFCYKERHSAELLFASYFPVFSLTAGRTRRRVGFCLEWTPCLILPFIVSVFTATRGGEEERPTEIMVLD